MLFSTPFECHATKATCLEERTRAHTHSSLSAVTGFKYVGKVVSTLSLHARPCLLHSRQHHATAQISVVQAMHAVTKSEVTPAGQPVSFDGLRIGRMHEEPPTHTPITACSCHRLGGRPASPRPNHVDLRRLPATRLTHISHFELLCPRYLREVPSSPYSGPSVASQRRRPSPPPGTPRGPFQPQRAVSMTQALYVWHRSIPRHRPSCIDIWFHGAFHTYSSVV